MIWLGLLLMALMSLSEGCNNIEVYFVVDKAAQDLYKKWGLNENQMREEIDYVITEVNKNFKTLNLSVTIYKRDLKFVNFDFHKEDLGEKHLAAFTKWVGNNHDVPKFDVAFLMTGRIGGGMAFTGTVCKSSGAALGEIYDGKVAAIMAHEIAHMLGAPHDSIPEGYIMGAKDRHVCDNCWSFSPQSRSTISSVLKHSEKAECLRSHSPESTIPNQSIPSWLNTADKICHRIKGTSACPYTASEGDGVCKVIWCKNKNYPKDRTCYQINTYDGMVCGQGKTCHHGRCVDGNGVENKGNCREDCQDHVLSMSFCRYYKDTPEEICNEKGTVSTCPCTCRNYKSG